MEALQDVFKSIGFAYYTTIKEFEKNKSKRRQRKKYRKLTSIEKLEINKTLNNELLNIFNIEALINKTNSLNININNYEELFEYFSEVNLIDFIKNATDINNFFPCKIIKGNKAWISKSEAGHYRYFSKCGEKATIGFDLVDLFEIYYGTSTFETVLRMVSDLNIKFMEENWVEEQGKKYISNLTFIHNPNKYIAKDYPEVFYYIKDHLKILETINVIGSINIKKKEFSYERQNIFFASNSYISDFVKTYSTTTTNKLLNLFATLGLIKKIPESSVPSQLLHKSKIISEQRGLGNIINYYIVPPMIDILSIANERAKTLKLYNVCYSNISKEKIKLALGNDIANEIYVQEIQKNKLKNIIPLNFIYYAIETNFVTILENKGFVTKTNLAKIKIIKTTKAQRIKEIEKIWRTLIIKHNLKYIKPTQEMKKKLKLKTNEYIAVKTTDM